jgi:hypothetical protein
MQQRIPEGLAKQRSDALLEMVSGLVFEISPISPAMPQQPAAEFL